jgi:hypothetical protein
MFDIAHIGDAIAVAARAHSLAARHALSTKLAAPRAAPWRNRMLALSDSQLEQLKNLAAPLHPRWRGTFLRALAAEIGDREVGAGGLHRIALRVRQSTIERAREPRRQRTAATAAIGGRP